MIYRTKTENGAAPIIDSYTVKSATAIAPGDFVSLTATDDEIDVGPSGAAGATLLLGAALEGCTAEEATAGKKIHVLIGGDNQLYEIPWTGALAAGEQDNLFGVTGATGAQKLDVDSTDNICLKLLEVTRNGAATGHAAGDQRAWVKIPSAKCQRFVAA